MLQLRTPYNVLKFTHNNHRFNLNSDNNVPTPHAEIKIHTISLVRGLLKTVGEQLPYPPIRDTRCSTKINLQTFRVDPEILPPVEATYRQASTVRWDYKALVYYSF